MHLNEEQLISFTLDELSDDERNLINNHLISCESCNAKLEEIIGLKEEWDIPTYSLDESFTDKIMDGLHIYKPSPRNVKTYSLISSFNFLIATAATFLLFYSGLFAKLPKFLQQFSTLVVITSGNVQSATGEGVNLLSSLSSQFSHIFSSITF